MDFYIYSTFLKGYLGDFGHIFAYLLIVYLMKHLKNPFYTPMPQLLTYF